MKINESGSLGDGWMIKEAEIGGEPDSVLLP